MMFWERKNVTGYFSINLLCVGESEGPFVSESGISAQSRITIKIEKIICCAFV